MEDEGVGLALAKAVDLRLKINSRIHKASSNHPKGTIDGSFAPGKLAEVKQRNEDAESHVGGYENGLLVESNTGGVRNEAADEDQEAERLLYIRDALESLENQLSHLQELHQQQLYEREVVRAEIEHSRQTLFRQLKDYKGEELQVIQEASAFVGDTLETTDQDLLLPPYRSVPPSLFAENQFLPLHPFSNKPVWNGAISKHSVDNLKEARHEEPQPSSGKWFGHVIGAVAKTIITVAGVLSVLTLSGIRPSLPNGAFCFNLQSLHLPSKIIGKKEFLECPPGKILAVEDGEARCVVKERVAVPFESLPANPDVNYGCG